MEGKVLTIFALALLAATGVYFQTFEQDNDDIYRMQYNSWKQENGRKYGGLEDTFRFPIFKSNLQFIEAHNQLFTEGKQSFNLDLNQFADLTAEEFHFRQLTYKSSQVQFNSEMFTGESVVANDSVDWRNHGAVNTVQNQGSCGSCWAFSASGAIEGSIFVRTGVLVKVAEQELVDCAGGKYGNEGCNGGEMYTAFQYVIDNGITTGQNYQYTGRDGKCKKVSQDRQSISSYTAVKPQSQDALRAALTQQPVSVAIDASGPKFQFYKSGVFDGACNTSLNHGVVAVGYGTEGKDYWLVRNSWGTTWGDKGYIKMVRAGDGHGQCGILDENFFPQ